MGLENNQSKEGPPIIRFLRQETAGQRGINTCYPTSVINAAIALGAVTTADATRILPNVVNELRKYPYLWKGGDLEIPPYRDKTISNIIERHIRVKLGVYDKGFGDWIMVVPRTFESLWKKLAYGDNTFVLMDQRSRHSMALVRGIKNHEGNKVGYVDPLDPSAIHLLTEPQFNAKFQPPAIGVNGVNVTQVAPLIRIVK